MKKPILLIMAAGMGSRYGGLKQIDPVDKEGNIILDYSIYDAINAGVEEVVCIIKKDNLEVFEELVGSKLKEKVKLHYAFQTPELPEGFAIPEGRVKPWGTGHAVLSAKEFIDGPFIVINADDFYGRTAFKLVFDSLCNNSDEHEHSMVGFELGKTLTENGHVARGVCDVDSEGNLINIVEHTHIEKTANGARFTEDGENFADIELDKTVSMNLWGFRKSIIDEFDKYFKLYLKENLPKNPLKCEFYINIVPDILIKEGKAKIKVLKTPERWFGVTYKADKPFVMESIQKMKDEGIYPQELWK